jgi:hypothetical protein
MTNSEKPLVPQRFQASSISRFSVIRVPYQFDGEARPISKLFVVVEHRNSHAICIKATHQTAKYENDEKAMAGCVYYKAGEVECFSVNTAIQPDNQFGISHAHIEKHHSAGQVEVHSPLPQDFQAKLQKAVEDSDTLSGRKRDRIRECIK